MSLIPTVDLNCDMGESFGAWTLGHDDALLPFITSANIACGFHAGDATTIRRTVAQERADYLADAAARHKRIRALRAEGLSMRAIAAKEGVTVGTVHYAIHKDD